MNIAVIIAGGVGNRMHQDIPKQFTSVFDKPVIIYALENFQKHPDIDAIMVVCLKGWELVLESYCRQFGISKLRWIVAGGENGQGSIRNAVFTLRDDSTVSKDSILLIHDSVRPICPAEVISDCIEKARTLGSAISVEPCNEAMLVIDEKEKEAAKVSYPRDQLMRTQTPQGFSLSKLVWAHETALERGILNSVASCTLLIELGEKVYFSKGSSKNFKITTQDDLDIFKALIKTGNN